MRRILHTLLVAALATLAFTGAAQAAGGRYVFDGGTRYERSQVKAALNASAFNWSLVPAQITVHIERGISTSEATRGEIWLDADLLDAGQFSWGVVQHEYAHEVDMYLLSDAVRANLLPVLGGKSWWWQPGLDHASLASERFASTLAWSYWPSGGNCLKPASGKDESAAMAPAKFRALLAGLLIDPSLLAASLRSR